MSDLILALVIFILVMALLVILRMKIGSKFEVRNSDILIAIIPVALWLILTGKIQKLEFGEFKIEAAFVEASKTAIAKQITPVKLPVETVRMDPKLGVKEIPRLIRNKTEALVFQLGYGGYYGPAIEEYLSRLSKYAFFKHIVINDSEGKFVGIADARELNSIFLLHEATYNSDDVAEWINRSKIASLQNLPGFVSAKDVIRKDADKQTALEKMEALNIETLPVIDERGIFAGVVDRSRLTASLIIDVSRKVR